MRIHIWITSLSFLVFCQGLVPISYFKQSRAGSSSLNFYNEASYSSVRTNKNANNNNGMTISQYNRKVGLSYSSNAANSDENNDENNFCSDHQRRIVFQSIILSSLTNSFLIPNAVAATTEINEQKTIPESAILRNTNFDCLLDLPPLSKDCVRVYLCRHGQTENNRLRKVQGSRVDVPINENGIMQAQGLGNALAKIGGGTYGARGRPKLILHSNLIRARMTAEEAGSQMTDYSNKKKPLTTQTREILSLREIDFGPVAEGQSVVTASAKMKAVAAAWAIGNIDQRPEGGGDSGREVLTRAAEALNILALEAEKNDNSCVAAVTHSAYLKLLLGLFANEALIESATRKVNNGSISVLDIRRGAYRQLKGSEPNKLFVGGSAPDNFDLRIPVGEIVRINETRHLPVL